MFSGVKWQKTTINLRESEHIYNRWHVFRDSTMPRHFDLTRPLPDGWAIHQPENDEPYYTYHAAPAYSFYYPIPTSYHWSRERTEMWGPVLRCDTLCESG